MTKKNVKDVQPNDMEPIIPGARDASRYPGNESGTVQSVPEDNQSETTRKEAEPKA